MEKHQAEQYYFPACDKHPWFIVTICENTGTVDIQSDHGDWQHRWSKLGLGSQTLKEFLSHDRTSYSYFENKFGYASLGRSGAGQWFDLDATVAELKTLIGNHPHYAKEIEAIDAKTALEFYLQLPIEILNKYEIPTVHTTHPQLRMFMDKCWPVFIEELKNGESKNTKSDNDS